MIISNEVELIERLREEGVDLKTIKKVLRIFGGWRIYFRIKKNENQEIQSTYNSMLQANYTRKQAVEILAEMYSKSLQTIKKLTIKQGELF